MIFGFEANVKKMMKGCTVISIEDELQEFMLTAAVRKPQAEEKEKCTRLSTLSQKLSLPFLYLRLNRKAKGCYDRAQKSVEPDRIYHTEQK